MVIGKYRVKGSVGKTAAKSKKECRFARIYTLYLAERWGFEPQNAFDTLHDFQSCALDQLSHLSISCFVWVIALTLDYYNPNTGKCQAKMPYFFKKIEKKFEVIFFDVEMIIMAASLQKVFISAKEKEPSVQKNPPAEG